MAKRDCIFCKIVAGESSTHKVYEDKDFLAFLDIRPLSPGHTLVIPKEHYRWVWDVPKVGKYFEAVRKLALALKKAFGTDFVLAKVVGDEIEHAHIWVFPTSEIPGDKNDLAGNAEKIREALG
ncbi:MAG: HIT domain-containing protein [Candidatus Taylorbacteria bacterium]|nr:HIT domain-containing protein [Candidatus Taylorbacteria bacterium]